METESVVNIFERKIGVLTVFSEQVQCAHKILSVFNKKGGPPILVAQMQQGKTGTCICVIDEFIKNCEATGLKYEIIILTNIADNDLREQTETRLTQANLISKVKNIHHGDLKTGAFVPDLTVDRRLIIIDECHVALEQSNMKELKPFHEFMKKCGIEYGQSIKTWGNQENYVLSVSATPYAAIIRSKIKKDAFEVVTLPVNENYYSLQDMAQSGRIRQSHPVVKGGKVTAFFKDCVEEFISECNAKGNGHMVVRSIGAGPKIIQKFLSQNYPSIVAKVFESAPSNNIPALANVLTTQYPMPYIAIIKGSLRAGKTLPTTKHIRMWIDPPKSKTDTMCQSVGRCLGFEMLDGKNRKFDDVFPVYCNMRELKTAIDFFDDFECIPTGQWNESTRSRDKFDVGVVDSRENVPHYAYGYEERHVNYTVSGNKENNLAKDILNQKQRGRNYVIFMDGPATANDPNKQDEFDQAWAEIVKRGWARKFAFYVKKGETNIYTSKIKKQCLLHAKDAR